MIGPKIGGEPTLLVRLVENPHLGSTLVRGLLSAILIDNAPASALVELSAAVSGARLRTVLVVGLTTGRIHRIEYEVTGPRVQGRVVTSYSDYDVDLDIRPP
jgi:hypothetical protein